MADEFFIDANPKKEPKIKGLKAIIFIKNMFIEKKIIEPKPIY